MLRQLGVRGGVQITKVDDKSVAEDAGLAEDMIITGVLIAGRFTEINSIADFSALESRLKDDMSLILTVRVPPRYERDINFSMKVKK